MYSPKIKEALIPRVYQAARKAKVPMTVWVDRAVEQALENTTTPEQPAISILNSSETQINEKASEEP